MNFLFLDTLGYESALRLSGHHYARLLVKQGHRVVSLSAPVTPWHRLARANRESIAKRFEAHHSGFSKAPGGVEHYVPHSWVPVRMGWPFDLDFVPELAARFYRRDILTRLSGTGFVPDVVSLQNLMFYPLVREFPSAVLQYRMTDKMNSFSDYPANLIRIESRVLDEADIISLTSRQFFSLLAEDQQLKALYAPNGVDIEHFSLPRPRPAAYEALRRPLAVYIGAVRAWFDWDLLGATARLLPEVQFVIISPDTPRADLMAEHNFIHIPGVSYEDVPAYYQHADVTIIPFVNSEAVAPVNPIKMFESLAAGTPVVCRNWEELRKLAPPISLADNAEAMAAAIRKEIGSNSVEGPGASDFLRQYSWEGNLQALLRRVEEIRPRKTASGA